ncbi:MAG TPA: hypothetical protein VGY54_11990 [Polyangiaceae bacterium]|jgi:hypothetical protein|nr:hypothetical protein [Polyangiaceae bacterium]
MAAILGTPARNAARVFALMLAVASATACGTNATGVDACRQIEGARCRRAPACGIPLQPPYHTAGSDVDACIRFYDLACLHGLAVNDPGSAAVQACTSAINNNGCAVVQHPEADTACAWLDAGAASSSPDASTDATDAGNGG